MNSQYILYPIRIRRPGGKQGRQQGERRKKMEAEFTTHVSVQGHFSGHVFSPAAALPWVLVSRTVVHPSQSSAMAELKLSVSDMPMLACNYIQKGLLFPRPPVPVLRVVSLLKDSLSRALSHFPPLAGRLATHDDGAIYVACDDSGVPFSHCALEAGGAALSLGQVALSVSAADVPTAVKELLFDLDGAVCYEGHYRPLAAVRLTELSDGAVFVGCSANHAVVDGTSFWNFFNGWAEICRRVGEAGALSRPPAFDRSFFGDSTAVLRFEDGREPALTFDPKAPLRERIFRFSGETLRELKAQVNAPLQGEEISTFQTLCALLWKAVTRARKSGGCLGDAAVTLRLAVNCRRRVEPAVDALYFGNAIQSIPTTAAAGDVATRGLRWTAALVHASVAGYGAETVRKAVAEWERSPRCFPLGNPDGTVLTVGSSPRFPVYDNDFGWGRPAAVRSGRANKFDGKASAFPSAAGDGGIDLELCLSPPTMAALVSDPELMSHVAAPEGLIFCRAGGH
ncbi:BAHD acyltransferase DCR-like [Wolffia australiana]